MLAARTPVRIGVEDIPSQLRDPRAACPNNAVVFRLWLNESFRREVDERDGSLRYKPSDMAISSSIERHVQESNNRNTRGILHAGVSTLDANRVFFSV